MALRGGRSADGSGSGSGSGSGTAAAEPSSEPWSSWDKYVGVYTDPYGWLADLSIVKQDGEYFLALHGGQPYPLSMLRSLTGELRDGPDGKGFMVTRLGVAERSSPP